ncbi:MAG: SMR family transporter [Aulosira sp. ZfuVER01]|nr:SMR family transporter [Aulosira sp. ZfuVER01]MDZ8001997.1 SMR family transporter [Aulosira sp. DedVER01a]MDZ8054925.1 SMR family transporter [Aulosira sp. ZfuCHP01]
MLSQFAFIILILVTVGLNTIAQILLKLGSGQNPLNLFIVCGLLAYGFSTIFYLLVLGKFNLSVAYPIVIGLTIIATTFAGAIFLREKVAMSHWLGIGLMLSGISAIALTKVYTR